MRSFALLGLAALLAAPAVSAQATFGLKAGVQAANVSFDEDTDRLFDDQGADKQARLGFVGGLTADIPITPSVAFRPEVLYSQKGYKVSFDGDADVDALEGSITAKVDYLEVPLLLAYNVVQPSGLAFSVEAGPTLGYKLSTGTGCDLEGGFGTLTCEAFAFDEDDEDDGVEDFDIGGALGATVGSGPFHVGVRYTQGFSNVTTEERGLDVDDEDGLSARNSTFAATLIYTFGAR